MSKITEKETSKEKNMLRVSKIGHMLLILKDIEKPIDAKA